MNKTILIVDDSFFMRAWLKNILQKNGYTVIGEAESGEEAIVAYFKKQPDIVMLDITLPSMNGITALKEIMKLDSAANVVMCSSMGQKDLIKEALDSGAKNFIVKPYFDQLVPVLDNVVRA